MAEHQVFMDEALALAPRGLGWVSPNPMVGALIVKDGVVIARGWHQKFGGPHAEVIALQEAGEKARNATLYVTLEPCNHYGKTPPCTNAIIAAGIRTVVYGAADPNSQASGGGAALKAAGLEVSGGIREEACKRINVAFFKRIRTGLPFIRLKWAMSADGRIATSGGDSKWISNDASRAASHRLRGEHDAVLIGVNTLIADNARLNCRGHEPGPRQPVRVIMDSTGRAPLDAALWSTPGAGRVVIVCSNAAPQSRLDALHQKGAGIIKVDDPRTPAGLEAVLRALVKDGVQSILVEGGSRVLGSFFDARHCDAVSIFIGPKLIGGSAAPGPLGGQGASNISEALALKEPVTTHLGSDVMVNARCGDWPWL